MLRLTLLLFACLAFTACDSGTPTPDADLDGTYVGQWSDTGGTFNLVLDVTTTDSQIAGDATISFTFNGDPFTSEHPVTGRTEGERVRFSIPFRNGLNFSGTTEDGGASVRGTIFRAVPGPSPGGVVDVETSIRITRS